MPIPKKLAWAKPAVTQFDSFEDARTYFMSKADPEDVAQVERIFEEYRGMQVLHDAERDIRRLRRWA